MNWKPITIETHRKISRTTCIIKVNGKEHYIPNDSIKFVMDEGWYVKEEIKLNETNT